MRRKIFLAAQWILIIAIVWYAVRSLRGQWALAAARLASLEPSWSWIALATVIVFLTYILLIETWRRIIIATGQALPFGDAARIWFVSNLGKYVPGKVWSIAAMTMMARSRNVSAISAAGSSVLIQIVTIAAGIGVALAMGAQAINQKAAAIVLVAVIALGLALTPRILPAIGRFASSATGRPIELPRIAPSVIWMTAASSAVAWIAYGLAFQFFVRGILGNAAGATSSYIAVYAASYIIGFLALIAPGGAVVRESAMVTGMVRLALSGQADALAVAVTSRLWLTVTELVPGLLLMAFGRRKQGTE